MIKCLGAVCMVLGVVRTASADPFTVNNGRFTNVYVLRNPDKGTWEQQLAKMNANVMPSDPANFTRASIDAATQTLMDSAWPNYFDALFQYGSINPPRFFGSFVASKTCVDAAFKHAKKGVLQADAMGSLANCHLDGMDPSPQVNLIFAPDILVANDGAADMCIPDKKGGHTLAYHGSGPNQPNFAVMTTSKECVGSFASFTESLSHEDVEMVSDPAHMGHGGTAGSTELGDRCQQPQRDVVFRGVNVQRYRSDNDNDCFPLAVPSGSTAEIWVLGEGDPKFRFTGDKDKHELKLMVPTSRVVTDAPATEVQIWIQTGGDDLRGGDHDNADITLATASGSTTTTNVNAGHEWGNGQTHAARLKLPAKARVSDIQSITIHSHGSGGLSGDNWNVNKVALVVAFAAGSPTREPEHAIVHTWLDKSDGPLVRMTGKKHNLDVMVEPHDVGKEVSALDVIVSTGNDDLRGGKGGDNCEVDVELGDGTMLQVPDANNGKTWEGWSDHTVSIPLKGHTVKGGDVKAVHLKTDFGGGLGGDNWNVQRVRLRATLK